jgi:hypothetical protein
MINPNRKLTATVCITWAVLLVFTAPMNVQAKDSAIDPAAVATLYKMAKYFSELEQFTVQTQTTFEDQLESGQRVDYDVAATVAVQRPNKIHAARLGEMINQDFYYDGESLTLYDPPNGVFATQPAPKTIEEVFDYTRESLGLLIPVSDLVYRNTYSVLMKNVTSASVIGKAVIGDMLCEHLAFNRPDVAFQVWVAVGDEPVPCKYVVTDTSAPELISTVTVMSHWNLAPELNDETFKFEAPEGATEISFIPLDETGDYGL